MKKLRILFLLFLLLPACKFSGNDIIPPDQMVLIMADMRLLEAGNSLDSNQQALTPERWKADYGFVFRKYNVNDSQFRQSYRHYFSRPSEFQRIMEKTITELQSREAGMKKKTP